MGRGSGGGEGAGEGEGVEERLAIPVLPFPFAVVCCILNFLIPGFGTMIAGFSFLCCPRDEMADAMATVRFGKCCQNCVYGFFQLFTVCLCLVGLFWSWGWGILFINKSLKFNNVGTTNEGRVISQQPHSVIATNSSGYTPKPDTVVTVTNESGSPLRHANSTTHPPAPPSYPGLASGPTDRDLYPPVRGTNNPAFPPDYNKLPPV